MSEPGLFSSISGLDSSADISLDTSDFEHIDLEIWEAEKEECAAVEEDWHADMALVTWEAEEGHGVQKPKEKSGKKIKQASEYHGKRKAEDPAWVIETESSLPSKQLKIVRPRDQSKLVEAMTETRQQQIDKIPQYVRSVPEVLRKESHCAFLQLPEEVVPHEKNACTWPLRGATGFTITNDNGAKVEVQLVNRAYMIKRAWDQPWKSEWGSPLRSWSVFKHDPVQTWANLKTEISW